MNIRDERENLVNEICMYIGTISNEDIRNTKNAIYLLMNDYEITTRSTEVAVLQEDRNTELVKRFLIAKKVIGRTDRTIEYYSMSIRKILEQIGKTVDDITTSDLRCYMALRQRRDKVSNVTIANEMRAMNSFFNWMYAEELIKTNPMRKIDRIKVQKSKKEALTEMEIEKLRGAARGERENFLIELLLSTGCRISEVTQIMLTDIEDDRILVHGKGQKDRYVYLTAKAQFAMEKYLGERKDNNIYLLPGMARCTTIRKKGLSQKVMMDWWKNPENVDDGHMATSTIEEITRKIAKRAGVEKANPHKFRRTCATMALRRGMPIEQVSKMLGHEELSTTQIYLDLSEEDLRMAHKKYVN